MLRYCFLVHLLSLYARDCHDGPAIILVGSPRAPCSATNILAAQPSAPGTGPAETSLYPGANRRRPFRATRKRQQPHIVLISADMVGPDLYHPARSLSQHVQIPAIRSLMQDGTFFSNAFCTVPLCSPSRASYLTGRYSYVQGNSERAPEGLETELRADDIIFPEYLKAAGYVTRQVGKCHVGAKKFLDAFGENDQPWDRWSPPVFDDDGFLAYQRSLGVKPQKYSREIVFRMQDRTTPGNSVGGWIVQEDGKPFPARSAVQLLPRQEGDRDRRGPGRQRRRSSTTPCICSSISSIRISRFPFPPDLKNASASCARS